MRLSCIVVLFIFPLFAQAQHQSKYAGQEKRIIKSLSESDIKEIESGNGWGLAKIAELNGFPGPKHVLAIQSDLGLSEQQIGKVQAVFDAMKIEAIKKGATFLEAEEELEATFQSGVISVEELEKLVRNSSLARSELRNVHLLAHLEMMEILTSHQIMIYNQIRGYSASDPCENIPEGHDPEMWKRHNNCSD